MHRFFLPPESFEGNLVIFPQDITHQLFHVLRLRPEAGVIVLDNRGSEFQVVLEQVSASAASGQIVSQSRAHDESVNLALYLCLGGREKFEWMLQKCTETGATAFIPVISSRSLVQDSNETNKKAARWEKIIQEAAEQSGRGRIPTLKPAASFAQATRQGLGTKIILWEQERTTALRQVLSGLTADHSTEISLLVGPEGGFAAEEVLLAQQAGWQPVSLGRRILRMETAAIVATALVIYELEK
jgi:16S rRNA (uracil1498-N3)-methyltransferase